MGKLSFKLNESLSFKSTGQVWKSLDKCIIRVSVKDNHLFVDVNKLSLSLKLPWITHKRQIGHGRKINALI